MESGRPFSLILCVLLLCGNWPIEEAAFIKLLCLFGSPYTLPLDDPTVPMTSAYMVLGGGQDINMKEFDLEVDKFIFKDSPVDVRPFLKVDLEDVKCELTPYFTANTQILWPGITNTDNALGSWYTYTLKHKGGKFHTTTLFTKLSGATEKKKDGKYPVLATLMLSTRTPYVYARLMDSVLLDCAFTVDHRADVSVTWSHRDRRSQQTNILSYNGITKKLIYNWKGVYMQVEELQNGNASLLVSNLAIQKSEGFYVCTVSVASLFIDQRIHLQIRESPKVSLNVDSVIALEEGNEKKFVCDVSNYYPLEVNIEWLRELPNTGLLPTLISTVLYSSHRYNSNGTYSLSAFFLYEASLKDNGFTFTCRVEHESLKYPVRKSVTLTVSGRYTKKPKPY
ncbi:tapasin-related protein-like isoform X2 [Eleutherodactylus coqui]|uniref:tapasin-related protein-like isoform X2 n=1 Tax=Eleutherodactylus coqui TaxID=57060 RepID=UPI003461C54D